MSGSACPAVRAKDRLLEAKLEVTVAAITPKDRPGLAFY